MIGVAYTNDSTLEVTVDTDLDTLATALYVKVDDALMDDPRLTRRPPAGQPRIIHQCVVHLHVQCGGEGVQIGVHGDLQGRIVGVSNADHGRLRRVKRGSRTSREPLDLLV